MSQSLLFEDSPSIKKPQPSHVRRVLVPYPVDKAYDYAIPDDLEVADGDYVCVPLSGREVPGVVWGAAEGKTKPAKLKAAIAKYPLKPMPLVHRQFLDWVARYNVAALGSALKMALSVPAGLEKPKPVAGYKASGLDAQKLTPQREKVMAIMADGQVRRAADIADQAGVSAGVVSGLADKGLLEVVEIYNPAPCKNPDPYRDGPELSSAQQAAADQLCAAQGFQVSLLDGVTGAGKTEVYFEAVAAALKKGKQVVILLPEIALSNAFLARFRERFGCDPALWHSHLTPAQRRAGWRGAAEGHSKVVVGARSALFLPYQDLGLIIVDEEHDPAYKQEDGVIYHARDMAIVRAKMGDIPIALVSATPSLETMQNVWDGKYMHVELPARFGGASMPQTEIIDMRTQKLDAQHFISMPLKQAIQATLEQGEQALLFLNRRGYAPLTLCRGCGHRMECPRCTAWLVEHKGRRQLQCHHCGFSCRLPSQCPECAEEDSFAACGPGVERIHEEARAAFPEARIMVLASDLAESDKDLRKMLDTIRDGAVDIVIGTQIIAKGHHFPLLTLVGVIDADLGLSGGELRGSERVYQLLHQVAGRAGREAGRQGHVMLQSFMPDHRIMQALAHSLPCRPERSEGSHGAERDPSAQALQDDSKNTSGRDQFLRTEAAEREQAHMPPFSRLAGIIVAGRDEGQVIDVAKALGMSAPQGEEIQTYGPAAAPLARLRGRWRYRLLVRANKNVDVQKAVRHWVGGIKVPSTVRVYIDIDPQSFL